MCSFKIGRNDPCPCGSGKKYKKCCGQFGDMVDVSLDPFTRYSQLLAAVKLKLDDHYSQRIKKMRKDLKEYFLRFASQPVLPQENESFYSEWLWFGARFGEGSSLGVEYLESHGYFMDGPYKDLLEALNHSYLSVYQVKNVEFQYLELEDIFLDESVRVMLKEPWEVDTDENQPLLLGRLVHLEKDCIFSGMVLIANNKNGERDFLRRHMRFISQLNQKSDREFLENNQEIVYGLFDHALKQVMVTFDHIETVNLEGKNKEALMEWLAQDQEWKLLHDTQGYKWYGSRDERFGYFRIAIGDQHLVFAAEVLDDIEYLQNTVLKMLSDSTTSIINNRFTTSQVADSNFSLWFLIVRDRETETWLRTPHIELDNQTPEGIMKDESGRSLLLQMLNEYIINDPTQEGRALLEYMQERVLSYQIG